MADLARTAPAELAPILERAWPDPVRGPEAL